MYHLAKSVYFWATSKEGDTDFQLQFPMFSYIVLLHARDRAILTQSVRVFNPSAWFGQCRQDNPP